MILLGKSRRNSNGVGVIETKRLHPIDMKLRRILLLDGIVHLVGVLLHWLLQNIYQTCPGIFAIHIDLAALEGVPWHHCSTEVRLVLNCYTFQISQQKIVHHVADQDILREALGAYDDSATG